MIIACVISGFRARVLCFSGGVSNQIGDVARRKGSSQNTMIVNVVYARKKGVEVRSKITKLKYDNLLAHLWHDLTLIRRIS